MRSNTAIALFTRDLRMHDNPTLQAAVAEADLVLPVFVFDEGILGSAYVAPNRTSFLVEALRDLDESLRECGSDGLVVCRGDPAEHTLALAKEVGARKVHVSGDWSRHAQRRQRRLEKALSDASVELVVHDETLVVVPPGAFTPNDKDHFAVFTPYHRRWSEYPRRSLLKPPRRLMSPSVRKEPIPAADALSPGERALYLPQGGETAGRRRMKTWLRSSVKAYADHHDNLAADDTSRMSPYLHFGCLSPAELVAAAGRSRGA